jgi:hypothetical protein
MKMVLARVTCLLVGTQIPELSVRLVTLRRKTFQEIAQKCGRQRSLCDLLQTGSTTFFRAMEETYKPGD